MKRQVVSLSEWRETRSEPGPTRVKHDRMKRRRSANLVKRNVVPFVSGVRSFPLGTRATLLVALLFVTAALWLWMVFRLDAIVAVTLGNSGT
jgi:hypothetical protein